MIFSSDILIFLGFVFFALSSFITLLDTFYIFISNEKIQKFSPKLYKFGEFFLLALLSGSLFLLLGLFFKLITLFLVKFKLVIKRILDSIENYLIKITTRSKISYSQKNNFKAGGGGSSGGGPQGSGGGSSNDVIISSSTNKRKRDNEDKEQNGKISKSKLSVNKNKSTQTYYEKNKNNPDFLQKDRERSRKYYQKHKDDPDYIEKNQEKNKRYYEEHKDELRVKKKEYARKNMQEKYEYLQVHREEMKIPNTNYENIRGINLPKSDPTYYNTLADMLKMNQGKTFSSFMSFSEKVVKDNKDSSLNTP
jgi:hypothetical protein